MHAHTHTQTLSVSFSISLSHSLSPPPPTLSVIPVSNSKHDRKLAKACCCCCEWRRGGGKRPRQVFSLFFPTPVVSLALFFSLGSFNYNAAISLRLQQTLPSTIRRRKEKKVPCLPPTSCHSSPSLPLSLFLLSCFITMSMGDIFFQSEHQN